MLKFPNSKKKNKNVAEFFAGIGLMRMGLEQSGWNVIWANDIDENKMKMYRGHFGEDNAHFHQQYFCNAGEVRYAQES